MEINNGYTGVPHVRSEDVGALYAAIFGLENYVLPTVSNPFAINWNTATEFTVGMGDLLINGRHGRIRNGETELVNVDSGSTGMKRIDLLVARYNNDPDTHVESISLVVIKGTETTGDPVVPDYISGDVILGSATADYPLYKLTYDGLNAPTVTKLFSVIAPVDHLVYRKGASLSETGVVCNGYLTNSSTHLYLSVPEKPFGPDVTSLNVRNLRIILLHPDGGYPYRRRGSSGGTYQIMDSTGTPLVSDGTKDSGVQYVTAVAKNGYIKLDVQFNWALVPTSGQSSPYVTNNVPVAAIVDYGIIAS